MPGAVAALRAATKSATDAPLSFWISIRPSTSASMLVMALTILARCRASSSPVLAPRHSRLLGPHTAPGTSRVVKKFNTLKLATFIVPPTAGGAAGRGLAGVKV